MSYAEWIDSRIAIHSDGVHRHLGRLMAAQTQLRLRLPGHDTRRDRCARIGRAVRELERHAGALRMLRGAV